VHPQDLLLVLNRPPRALASLGFFGVGYPRDEEDLAEILALFQEAGIATGNYQALR
jgi:hypothetical protein